MPHLSFFSTISQDVYAIPKKPSDISDIQAVDDPNMQTFSYLVSHIYLAAAHPKC